MRKTLLQIIILQLILQTMLHCMVQFTTGKLVTLNNLGSIFLFSFIIGPLAFITGLLFLKSSYQYKRTWENKKVLAITLSRFSSFSNIQAKTAQGSLINCSYSYAYVYGVTNVQPFKSHKLELALLGICMDIEYTMAVKPHEEVTNIYVDEAGTIIKNSH